MSGETEYEVWTGYSNGTGLAGGQRCVVVVGQIDADFGRKHLLFRRHHLISREICMNVKWRKRCQWFSLRKICICFE